MVQDKNENLSPATFSLEEKDACGVGFIFRPDASHQVIEEALTALARVEHRGACGADQISGDGAGILTSIPWRFFESAGWQLATNQAIGVLFLPIHAVDELKAVTESTFQSEGMSILAWRAVPTRPEVLGPRAKFSCPQIVQIHVQAPQDWTQEQIEQRLDIVRKRLLRHALGNSNYSNFSVTSLSTRTIVYKALAQGAHLVAFYPDLGHPDFSANWALFHRRFSTNTMPRWALAQPFRLLGHNGEINSLLGNRNWLKAKAPILAELAKQSIRYTDDAQPIADDEIVGGGLPIIDPTGSDSANLDDVLELYLMSGYTVNEALMILMPEPCRDHPLSERHPEIADFYEYHAALQEPWDGPALIVYSDGKTLGAAMDRNGLRPCRYTIMDDGSAFLCSESGALDIPIEQVVKSGRLGPGQMLCIDLETGRLRTNLELKLEAATMNPYRDWLEATRLTHKTPDCTAGEFLEPKQLMTFQNSLGYGKEDLEHVITPMAESSHEPVHCMGDDTPLAVLSDQPRVLFDYFKQRFAQVTNPPIDHLRERIVMSLDVYLGSRTTLLKSQHPCGRIVHLRSPILTDDELQGFRKDDLPDHRAVHAIAQMDFT